MVRLKQNKQSITSIYNDQGQYLHTYDQIAEEVVGFFTKLLGVSNPNVSGCSIDLFRIFCAPPFLMKLVMIPRVRYLVRR
ncbi:hypothetical protein V6N13_087492 [Hibiscus sabdariffa]